MRDPFEEEDEFDRCDREEQAGGGEDRQGCACGQPTLGEECGFCGEPLCPACFEMGGGFCSKQHTQEQIDAYEDALLGPADAARRRRRHVRDELRSLGIL